ncbi:hypothetical protein D6827_00510 [Candidatus Parcubacteria bacterium]|nr:MAG: hypothetical protein D6827_00510 [Candidatus Parcubacteria bacterium]
MKKIFSFVFLFVVFADSALAAQICINITPVQAQKILEAKTYLEQTTGKTYTNQGFIKYAIGHTVKKLLVRQVTLQEENLKNQKIQQQEQNVDSNFPDPGQ